MDSNFSINKEFQYPFVPRKNGETEDWRQYPRCPSNTDLCTMRVDPNDSLGWFVVERQEKPGADERKNVMLAYLWERTENPWLMTWEENRSRIQPPWNGRTLCRGMEFGSYAMAMGRKWNVEQGKLLGVPTFEWLDAHETKKNTFWMTMWTDRANNEMPVELVSPRSAEEESEMDGRRGRRRTTRRDIVVRDKHGRADIRLF